MPRHKHADVIIAWANGEEVQSRVIGTKTWDDICHPKWLDSQEYRIKPKTVKREAWLNVYNFCDATMWRTKQEADRVANPTRKACIRIEWEEEV